MKTLASVPAFFLSPVLMVTENVVDLSAGEEDREVNHRSPGDPKERERKLLDLSTVALSFQFLPCIILYL